MAGDGRPVRILGLTEGDPTTTLSGAARFLLDALAPYCEIVQRLEYGVSGAARIALAAATARPSRDAWRARFHTSRLAHEAMTGRLRRRMASVQADYDLALQVAGWTAGQPHPYALYLDQTRLMAERRYPQWLPLRARERAGVLERERAMFASAAHLFTMGAPGRQSLIEDYGIDGDRVTVVGGGLNYYSLPAMPALHAEARAPVVLFVGREFHRKGGDVLLEAFAAVRRAVPGAVLHLVGVSPRLSAPGVIAHGKIADRDRLSELYGLARAFCMPSRYEPYGLVFIEAMAHGVPCVGTGVQSIPEILGHGRGGLVVPAGDPGALSAALIELLTDDQLAGRLSRDGRQLVEEHLRWDHVARRMLPALEAIAAVKR